MMPQTTTANPKYNIGIIGGCHINGYLVGKENSFVNVLFNVLQESGISVNVSLHQFITLCKSEKLKQVFDNTEIDVLILQLGNYEFSYASYVRKAYIKLRSDDRLSFIYDTNTYNVNTSVIYRQTFTKRLLLQIKHLSNLAINYSLFNKKYWEPKIDKFFLAIANEGIKHVIVIEPLPTKNKVINIYRRKGGALLKEQSEKHGFKYVTDLYNYFDQELSGNFTADENHLNIKAHNILGRLLANTIQKTLKGLPNVPDHF